MEGLGWWLRGVGILGGGNNNALKLIVVMDTQQCKILKVIEVYTLNMWITSQ